MIAPGSLSASVVVTLKLEYDGDNTFTFTANGSTVVADGPPRLGAPFDVGRGMRTGINTHGPAGETIDDCSAAQVVAHFDDVIVDNPAHDDFSAADIDRSNWWRGKMLRSVSAGALRIESESPD